MAYTARMSAYKFLNACQAQRLHNTFVDKRAKPTQPELLESAIAAPVNIKHYQAGDNIFQLAANLADKIMKNHSYQDGNKRTAYLAADIFLKLNGYLLQESPPNKAPECDSMAKAHVAVCTNAWTVDDLARHYEKNATPIGRIRPKTS